MRIRIRKLQLLALVWLHNTPILLLLLLVLLLRLVQCWWWQLRRWIARLNTTALNSSYCFVVQARTSSSHCYRQDHPGHGDMQEVLASSVEMLIIMTSEKLVKITSVTLNRDVFHCVLVCISTYIYDQVFDWQCSTVCPVDHIFCWNFRINYSMVWWRVSDDERWQHCSTLHLSLLHTLHDHHSLHHHHTTPLQQRRASC